MADEKMRTKVMKKWDFTSIDLDMLPEQWNEQFPLYERWSKRLATITKERADLEAEKEVRKADMKRAEAEAYMAVSRRPSKYGIKRVTDTSINQAVLLQRDFQKAQAAFLAMGGKIASVKELEDVTRAACITIWMRKEGLIDQVKMQMGRAYAEPRLPQGSEGVVRDLKARATKKTGRSRYGK